MKAEIFVGLDRYLPSIQTLVSDTGRPLECRGIFLPAINTLSRESVVWGELSGCPELSISMNDAWERESIQTAHGAEREAGMQRSVCAACDTAGQPLHLSFLGLPPRRSREGLFFFSFPPKSIFILISPPLAAVNRH